MRNLKKILALVLALVMSLSLMATASAADFPDADKINEKYQTAVEVLTGLEVFKGDADGSFHPEKSITRAETAAIIYRIVTGDVKDDQVKIYSDYNLFSDVAPEAWYAGYVNFCANAEYIKGMPDGTFKPNQQVTGYAALAMILRAIGYTANGGFTGSDWEVQTARTAEARKITKNIMTGTLGQPASRESVAEILFQAILVNMVDHNVDNTFNGSQGYFETDMTLGYKTFKLEEVTGVVTANEYADLYDTNTLPDGKTNLQVDGKTYTINYTSTLDDIGETFLAYITGSKVLSLADDGKDYPETYAETTLNAFLKENNLSTDSNTEEYINFGPSTNWTSDWKIKYVIAINNITTATSDQPTVAELDATIQNMIAYYAARGFYFNLPATYLDGSLKPQYALRFDGQDNKTGEYYWTLTYTVEYRINEDITPAHQQNIKEIFNVADKLYDSPYGYITGEVYVGTTSLKDVSDEMSLNQFVDTYIKMDDEDLVPGNENGNWLKVIDVDGDGVAEYVFKTIYTVAQVASVKDDVVTLDVKNHDLKFDTWQNPGNYKVCGNDEVNTLTSEPVVSADELKVLDVVYYAVIDGKAQTYLAEEIGATKIEKVDHNALTATTTTGDVYTQAGVHEHIEDEAYMHFVRNLSGNVNYDLYLVNGYLAAFVKTDVTGQFVLITDGWFNQKINEKEYAIKIWDDENNKQSDPIIISAPNATLFVRDGADGNILNNNWGALKYFGVDGTKTSELNGDSELQANRVHTIIAALDQETGLIVPVENSSVTGRYQTNILDLHYTGSDGKLYQKLPTMGAATGIVYRTAESSSTTTAYNQKGASYDVRALNDTVYYTVVSDGATGAKVVAKAVGYANAPDLTSSAYRNNVEDIYAVGTLHRPDNNLNNGENYYVASIVVIEVNSWSESSELIFVVDDTMRYSNVYFRDLQVIRANGALENITVDFSGYTGGYWDNIDNHKRVQPGFYKMYPTGVKDSDGKEIWRIQNKAARDQQQDSTVLAQPLTHEELAKEKVAAGQVNLVEQFGSKNYLVTRNWTAGKTVFSAADGNWYNDNANGLNGWSWSYDLSGNPIALQPDQRTDNYNNAAMGKNGGYTVEGRYEIGAETPLYTLAYGESWTYNTVSLGQYTGADWATVFAARMNETTSAYHPGREDVKYYNNDGVQQNGTWFNNNDVVVVYNGNKIAYAISFANLRNNDGDPDDAQNIWLNSVPTGVADPVYGTPNWKFFGQTAKTGLTYAETKAATEKTIVVSPTSDSDIASVTITDSKNNAITTTADSNGVYTSAALTPDPKTGETYTVKVLYKDKVGDDVVLRELTWTFTVGKGNSGAKLQQVAPIANGNGSNNSITLPGTGVLITWMQQVKLGDGTATASNASDGAKVEWTMVMDGVTIKAEGVGNQIRFTSPANAEEYRYTNIDGVLTSVEILVTSEDGSAQTAYSNTTLPDKYTKFTVNVGANVKVQANGSNGAWATGEIAPTGGFTGTFPAARSFKDTIGSTTTYIFVAQGAGTFEVTGAATTGYTGYMQGLDTTIVYVTTTGTGNCSVTFTPDQTALTVVAGTSVAGAGATLKVSNPKRVGEAFNFEIDPATGAHIAEVKWYNGTNSGNAVPAEGSGMGNFWTITKADAERMVSGTVRIEIVSVSNVPTQAVSVENKTPYSITVEWWAQTTDTDGRWESKTLGGGTAAFTLTDFNTQGTVKITCADGSIAITDASGNTANGKYNDNHTAWDSNGFVGSTTVTAIVVNAAN